MADTREITVKANYYPKPLMLRTSIGSGTLGKVKFELDTCMNGCPYVSIKGKRGAVVLELQSFIEAAIEILEAHHE